MNFSYCKIEKTEALGKNEIKHKIVLYPNSCYIDACYNEVDLYISYILINMIKISDEGYKIS